MCISLLSKATNRSVKMSYLAWCLVALYVTTNGHISTGTITDVIETSSGLLQGLTVGTGALKVSQFRNIPYAKPPVGELRFKKPVPYGRWEGLKDATQFGNICPQNMNTFDVFKEMAKMLPAQSEDCLSLNIYVPGNVKTKNKKSVMVYIHGGGFSNGDGIEHDGTYLALGGDVIVVTINYRIGILGFLSTGDDVLPGNLGLWDQILAITWIHYNIESFGGDTDSITIFGESAGSYSVGFQSMITLNKGVFQKAVLQSGAPTMSMSLTRNPLEIAVAYGKALDCISGSVPVEKVNKEELIDCYRKQPFQRFVAVQGDPSITRELGMSLGAFFPCLDGELIRKHPKDLLQDEKSDELFFFRTLDVMSGTTNLEGAFVDALVGPLQVPMQFDMNNGIPTRIICDVIAPILAQSVNGDATVSKYICESCKGSNDIDNGRKLAEFLGDAFTISSTIELLNFHAQGNKRAKTYRYLFSREIPVETMSPRLPWLIGRGASHGTSNLCLFGPAGTASHYKDKLEGTEGVVSAMVTYWTNFAKTSNPNNAVDDAKWPHYTVDGHEFMDIGQSGETAGAYAYTGKVAMIKELKSNHIRNKKTEL